MSSLIRLIETGSYTSKDDLDNLIKSLEDRVRRGRRKLKTGFNYYEVQKDLNKASIFLEEFKSLRDSL